MKLTLLCEVCHVKHFETRLGVFESDNLEWPLNLTIFKSYDPKLLPDPFPVGLRWDETRCRQCQSRPFLNAIPQQDGKVMLVDGTRKEQGAEGRVLTMEVGYIPIPGYPGAAPAPPIIKDADGNFGIVVEQMEKPGAPPFETVNGPVTCPVCGQEYQTQSNLDRYHRCKGAD